ncbi:uncharacterized protein LOC127123641 [Lathyrus oleraceus]|uniref:uncharacterized protein LOC127123641 n=1 Tax=Pisum sativum TaxID=3888 RepID=UPI0021D368A4|nr:uncharacterized protein LOC127123641 [Pisum sativum]
MRTSLDDILSELRHQNDAEAERDVLLRNLHRQQEEMRITINQLRDSHVDYVERDEHNMVEHIEQMIDVRMEVSGTREYMQHMPHPAFGRGAVRVPPKKVAPTTKRSTKAREEDTSKATTTKPKATDNPKKRKQKETEVKAIESDDEDLSPDASKPTKQRRKKQLKLQGSPIHPKTKTNASKRPSSLKIPGAESEPKLKKTLEQMESDNSSPGVEDPKAVAGSPQHPTITLIVITILPESSGAPTYHATTSLDFDKGSIGEVNNPATERQENSPPKITTQHSHTSGSEHEDEQDEDAPVEKDAEMQDAREIPEDESEDGSPETNQDMGDPDNEEEDDQSIFNFDIEPPEDEDEDRNDVGDEERNVQADQ